MNFRNPQFLRSGWTMDGVSPGGRAVAFAGRSNAGKSSALNALCGGRFARAAKTPGRTRTINLFELTNGHLLADLPGYGYASVSQDERRPWGARIGQFLRAPQIAGAVLVVDCRRGLDQRDIAFLQMLDAAPALLLLNKTDKLNRSQTRKCLEDTRLILADFPQAQVIAFSALKKTGAQEARKIIAGFLEKV